MSLVSFQFLGVHYIPALAVLVVDEGVLVAIGLDGSLQRHQRSLRTRLIGLDLRRVAILRCAGILLRESIQAHRESQSQHTDRYFFHRSPLSFCFVRVFCERLADFYLCPNYVLGRRTDCWLFGSLFGRRGCRGSGDAYDTGRRVPKAEFPYFSRPTTNSGAQSSARLISELGKVQIAFCADSAYRAARPVAASSDP